MKNNSVSLERLSEIIEAIIAPSARSVDEDGSFPEKQIRALGEIGLFGLMIPVEFGGIGASARVFADATRMLGRSCAPTAMVYLMHVTSVSSLVSYMNTAQRRRYLDPVVSGQWL